jgi:hypothetical protein
MAAALSAATVMMRDFVFMEGVSRNWNQVDVGCAVILAQAQGFGNRSVAVRLALVNLV